MIFFYVAFDKNSKSRLKRFHVMKSNSFENYCIKKACLYDEFYTDLLDDGEFLVEVYHGLNGSYSNPIDWDLLGFKVIYDKENIYERYER